MAELPLFLLDRSELDQDDPRKKQVWHPIGSDPAINWWRALDEANAIAIMWLVILILLGILAIP